MNTTWQKLCMYTNNLSSSYDVCDRIYDNHTEYIGKSQPYVYIYNAKLMLPLIKLNIKKLQFYIFLNASCTICVRTFK